ncbi:MAG: hypothetical protein KKD69_04980 [Euryarchaeota archaeon]|nr:hypothetical protein [Euryarchaeota archaeon]MBU4491799.1 hypothetical protein [Euryarchaeota archaeon]MCG2727129.1 hypothetical protein [Candidatus Methanoperedenaceae archaeon]
MKQIQITLNPSESKRIIAMGVKKLPVIQQALKKGIILITLGSTNAYVAEELTGKKIDHARYGAGYIDGTTTVVPIDTRLPTIALRDGKQVADDGIIKEMGCGKATGLPVGMMPLCGTVITEVEALTLLGADDVFPIGAGGINGGEGSVTLCVIGDKADEIFELVQKVKEKIII